MTCTANESPLPGTPKRRRSVENGSETVLNLAEEPVLIPLLEDLTIWLSGCLSAEVTPENFIEMFEDGVLFCRLASILHAKALEFKEMTQNAYPLPQYSIRKWYENPKIGSFFCRDNVCKFINWCKQFGVSEICLFESNDIVEHRSVRSLRNVLVCLLDIGRIGVKHGIEPSELVQIEIEIEKEIQLEIRRVQKSGRKRSKIPTPRRMNSSLSSSLASSSEPATSEDESEGEMSSPEPSEEELERIRLKLMSLDEQVRAIVSRCTCKTPFQLDRVGDGKYKLPQTSQIFFVRILRNHVMVRVGGGWDTLDHFIAKHDPCRMKFKQIAGIFTPNYNETQSKINSGLHDPSPTSSKPSLRHRSISCISPPTSPHCVEKGEVSDDVQSWVSDDYVPLAKVPRNGAPLLTRSRSARYARKLSYSSDSEEPLRMNESLPVEFDLPEDELCSPLLSLRQKIDDINSKMSDDAPLTSFSQTPRKPERPKSTDRTPRSKLQKVTPEPSDDSPRVRTSEKTGSRSMIPVSNNRSHDNRSHDNRSHDNRSKSCERYKQNIVMSGNTVNRSKSGDRMNNFVMSPARKPIDEKTYNVTPKKCSNHVTTHVTPHIYVTPQTPLKHSKSGEKGKNFITNVIQSSRNELERNSIKTPQSLLSNPTSATARKVLRSKSSENMANNVKMSPVSAPINRPRAKSTDTHSTSKISKFRAKTSSGLSKSMSSDVVKNNLIQTTDDVIMKPDLSVLNGSTPKNQGRSFRDWLKRRKNEN